MTQTDELLTVEEAAHLLGVKVTTMYMNRTRGTGPLGSRRGRRLVFRRSDLDSFLLRERLATLRGAGL
jgi:excisionase family DNA binding protein